MGDVLEFRDGVININKPQGWTSQDVCARLRHRLRTRRIGHTGTLDPMATGVLPVCTGKATRIIEYYDMDRKTYRAEMRLGITTDTLDVTGKIIQERSFEGVTTGDLRRRFEEYRGAITQIPPKYSALKVNGRRAYDLARAGEDFELCGREIMIYSNEMISADLETGTVCFEVTCSKGTYIRTICDDIGRSLGCGAAMSALERTASGCFRSEDAVGIEEVCSLDDEEILRLIIPADETLMNLGRIDLREYRRTAFLSGNPSDRGYEISERTGFVDEGRCMEMYRVYSGGFLGIGGLCRGTLFPIKVLAQ